MTGMFTSYKYERYFDQKGHMKYKEQRDLEGVHQAVMSQLVEYEAYKEEARL